MDSIPDSHAENPTRIHVAKLAQRIFDEHPARFPFTLTQRRLMSEYGACGGGRRNIADVTGVGFPAERPLPLYLVSKNISSRPLSWMLSTLLRKGHPLARHLAGDVLEMVLTLTPLENFPGKNVTPDEARKDALNLIAHLRGEIPPLKFSELVDIREKYRYSTYFAQPPQFRFYVLMGSLPTDDTFSVMSNEQSFVAEMIRLRVFNEIDAQGEPINDSSLPPTPEEVSHLFCPGAVVTIDKPFHCWPPELKGTRYKIKGGIDFDGNVEIWNSDNVSSTYYHFTQLGLPENEP